GASSPVSAASRVDLPLPDGPSTAVTLPRGTDRSMPDRIVRPPRSRRTASKRTAIVSLGSLVMGGDQGPQDPAAGQDGGPRLNLHGAVLRQDAGTAGESCVGRGVDRPGRHAGTSDAS